MDVYGPLDLRLKSGTCMQIVAPSRSGKTKLALDIVINRNKVYDNPTDKCVYMYKQWQPAFEEAKSLDNSIIFSNDFEELETLIKSNLFKNNLLVIFDDFMLQFESSKNSYIKEFFVHRAHHENISVILLQQVLYSRNSRVLNLNAHYLILFSLPRDSRQVMCLGSQMMPENSKFVYNCYKVATSKPYSYLFIDLYPSTPEYARFSSSVFVNKNKKFYLPK